MVQINEITFTSSDSRLVHCPIVSTGQPLPPDLAMVEGHIPERGWRGGGKHATTKTGETMAKTDESCECMSVHSLS